MKITLKQSMKRSILKCIKREINFALIMIKYILKEQEIAQLMGKTIVLLFMKFQNAIKLIKILKIQI